MAAAPVWHPFREIRIEEGEVQHIHNLSMEEAGIAAILWKKLSQAAVIRRLGEDQAVKCTVQNIAQSAGEDQCKANQQAGRHIGAYQQAQVIDQKTYSYNAEQTQGQLSVNTSQGNAKSHAVIFYEMDERPVQSKDFDLIAVIHVRFHPYLQALVNDEDQKDNARD